MRLWHVGIIVKNLEDALEYYKALPGADSEWKITRGMSFAPETCIIGEPCTIDIAFGNVGGLPCELIQPVSNYSMQMEALKNRGEHIHHVAYIVGDQQEEIVKRLEATGATKIWENNDGVVHCIFIKAKDGGMIYELADVHPDEI